MTTRALTYTVLPTGEGFDSTSTPYLVKPTYIIGGTGSYDFEYGISGAVMKRNGTIRQGAIDMDSGTGGTQAPTRIFALADFWLPTALLSATQRQVAIVYTDADGELVHDGGNGVWTNIALGGATDWEIPSTQRPLAHITLAGGYAVFSDGFNIPAKWDQTTRSDLGTTAASTPRFSASTYHLRRLFTGGALKMSDGAAPGTTAADPSTLYYSAAGNIADFSGIDAGAEPIGVGDGDIIIGLSQPFRGAIYIFKGRQYGSCYRWSGRSLASFQSEQIFRGAPCLSHKSIVTTPNDVYWVSRYGIHSLLATDKYGDLEEHYISRPIQSTFAELYDKDNFGRICGYYHPQRNYVAWSGFGTDGKWVLLYYPAREEWAIWSLDVGDAAECSAMLIDETTQVARPNFGVKHASAARVITGDDITSAYVDTTPAGTTNVVGFSAICAPLVELPGKSRDQFATLHGLVLHLTADSFTDGMDSLESTALVRLDGRLTTYGFTTGPSGSGATGLAWNVPIPITDGGPFRELKLNVLNSEPAAAFGLIGYTIHYTPGNALAGETTGA